MGGFQTAKIVTLHAAGKTFPLGRSDNIDILTGDEALGGQSRANRDQIVRRDTEFRQIFLRLHLRLGEMAALRLGNILYLGLATGKLKGAVTVPLFRSCATTWQSST